MNDIPVRKMAFEIPTDFDLVFLEDDPETSYMFVGAWFMLPYLEPYLMRSINAAVDHVKSDDQREEMRRFVRQEGQHYQVHARANEVIRARKPAYAALEELEERLAGEYKNFTKTKSLKFNLAYAEGFESLTSAFATAQIELGVFDKPGNPLRELALWHVMEELEHRNVAFEAYAAVGGNYFHRIFVGTWAIFHYLKWIGRMKKVLKNADLEAFAAYDNSAAKARRNAVNSKLFRKGMGNWLATYLPWYTPRNISLPSNFNQTRQRFTDKAKSVS